MEIFEVDINILKQAEYNPRGMTEEEAQGLRESLSNFGMVEPIVVNKFKGREYVIVGGHQRYLICKEMGLKTIPVVYVELDEEREKELNLRLNRNLGHWDWDMLANLSEDLLRDAGFDRDEMARLSGMKIDDLVDNQDVDITRFDVVMVDGPNSPRLKNRKGFYFETIEEFNEVVEFFKTNLEYKLDGKKLIEFIKQK